MEATAREHQRRRFEEEPFGATIVSMEEYREMIANRYFDWLPAEPGLMRRREKAQHLCGCDRRRRAGDEAPPEQPLSMMMRQNRPVFSKAFT